MTVARLYWLFPILVAVITFLTFLPALQNDWVNWDDTSNFLQNKANRGLGVAQLKWMWSTQPEDSWSDHYIPLSWMTLGLDYKIWRMNPFGYHLTNILLHSANAALVYLLAVAIFEIAIQGAPGFGIPIGALFAALVFAVHPLRVESVAWITERRDVLSGLFWLGAVLAYIHAFDPRRPFRRKYYWVCLACFALALLSKEIAITLPAVLLILDVYPLRQPIAPGRWILEKIPFGVIGVALAVTVWRLARGKEHFDAMAGLTWFSRIGAAVYNLAFYLGKTLAPVRLSPFYPFTQHKIDPAAAPLEISIIVVLSITAAAVILWRRFPALAAAWLVFIVILSPVLGLIPSGPRLSNDRNTYLACLGWALLAGAGMAWCWRRLRTPRWLIPTIAGIMIVALAALTRRQISVWRDSDALWTQALAVEPSFVAYNNMGEVLVSRGDDLWASDYYRKAIAMRPDFAPSHIGLGGILLRLNRPDEAAREFQITLDLRKDLAEAQNGLACALAYQGKLDEAILHFDRAIQLRPGYDDARRNLAQVLARRK